MFRIKNLYHGTASYVLLARYFLTMAVCRTCKFDEESGLAVLCDKHHERLFLMEGRAYDHWSKIPL